MRSGTTGTSALFALVLLLGASTAHAATGCADLREAIRSDQQEIAYAKIVIDKANADNRADKKIVDEYLDEAEKNHLQWSAYNTRLAAYRQATDKRNQKIRESNRQTSEAKNRIAAANQLWTDLRCEEEFPKPQGAHCDDNKAEDAMADAISTYNRLYPNGANSQPEYDWYEANIQAAHAKARTATAAKNYDAVCKIYNDLKAAIQQHKASSP